ncbi:MAG: glycosyltransferase family 2 protein [Chlorobi bacterium]|nr:glycosyltransferase family 2 protein [Chlorobiota bacterium]
MAFADTYFKRFNTGKINISEKPAEDLFLSIVVPAYNEPELCKSLMSLKRCIPANGSVEVLVIINSGENTNEDVISKNRATFEKALKFAKKNNTGKLRFYILNFENLPAKSAGVGTARKIGMDEALRRFNFLNKPQGIIAGFDADAEVSENYLKEIETYFTTKPEIKAASIYFEHPVEGKEFPEHIYRNIINYELHLRYFVEALRIADFPFAYHTIGSAFAVRAGVYAAQGGMNRRKAGEDFYFLQKIIPLGNYGEINTAEVIPSPRISDRVPFGTGAAISKMIKNKTSDFGTYDFEIFLTLKKFFNAAPNFFDGFSYTEDIPEIIKIFLEKNKFDEAFAEIKRNSPDINIFTKRFFGWFNAFRIIKFLNFAHETYCKKQAVYSQALKLLKYKYPEIKLPVSEKETLFLYRNIQKKDFNL